MNGMVTPSSNFGVNIVYARIATNRELAQSEGNAETVDYLETGVCSLYYGAIS